MINCKCKMYPVIHLLASASTINGFGLLLVKYFKPIIHQLIMHLAILHCLTTMTILTFKQMYITIKLFDN